MPVNKKSPGSRQEKSDALLKDGFPAEAFAITGASTDLWQLQHHTKSVLKPGWLEQSVDWVLMERCVRQLSRQGIDGRRIAADPSSIIHAACHLAVHYNKCGRPLPLALCVLVTNEI
jgi:hypothetical protein